MTTYQRESPYRGLRDLIEVVCRERDRVKIGGLVDGSLIPPIGDELDPPLRILAALDIRGATDNSVLSEQLLELVIAHCDHLAHHAHSWRQRWWQQQVVGALVVYSWLIGYTTARLPEATRARLLSVHKHRAFLPGSLPECL